MIFIFKLLSEKINSWPEMITNVLNNLIDFKTMMNQNPPNDIIEIPGNAFLVQIVEIALTEITTTCRLNQP